MKFKVDNLECSALISDELIDAYKKYGIFDSDYCRKTVELEFNSLEDLKSFSIEFDQELIINFDDMTITIYDGYNE